MVVESRERGVWLWLVDQEGMDPKEEDRWWLVGSTLKPRERVAAARRNEEDGTSCLISRVGSRVYIAGGFD